MEKTVFKNFADYWFYARCLSLNQRDIILSNLPEKQKEKLIKSYKEGGWEDLVMRNEIDKMIDEIKENSGIDLLQIRCKVFSEKSVYMNKSKWQSIIEKFEAFQKRHIYYILGGIIAEDVNEETILLVRDD